MEKSTPLPPGWNGSSPVKSEAFAKFVPKKVLSKKELSSLPAGKPSEFLPEVVETKARPPPASTAATVSQYVPAAKLMLNPVTSTWYSVKPKPLRPVATDVAALVPLATSVPPLPAETPERISQYAVLGKLVSISSLANTVSTFQPPAPTMKLSYVRASLTMVFFSLARPLKVSKSPLYQS